MNADEAPHSQLRRAIEQYALAHPNACDTLQGIADWWLPAALVATPEHVERAVNELVEASVLRCTRLVDGTPIYAVRPPPCDADRHVSGDHCDKQDAPPRD